MNLPFSLPSNLDPTLNINLSSGRQKSFLYPYTTRFPVINPTASSFRENSLTFLSSKVNPLENAVKTKSAVRKAMMPMLMVNRTHICVNHECNVYEVLCVGFQTIKEQQTKHDNHSSCSHSQVFSFTDIFLQSSKQKKKKKQQKTKEKRSCCVYTIIKNYEVSLGLYGHL